MRKTPWINLATALFVNIPEFAWYFYVNSLAPNHPTYVKAFEAFFEAALNIATLVPSYSHGKEGNVNGFLANSIFGGINCIVEYTRTNITEQDTKLTYPPQTVSRIIQPYVNLFGIAANAGSYYDADKRVRNLYSRYVAPIKTKLSASQKTIEK